MSFCRFMRYRILDLDDEGEMSKAQFTAGGLDPVLRYISEYISGIIDSRLQTTRVLGSYRSLSIYYIE
jgi:hypothetical protein